MCDIPVPLWLIAILCIGLGFVIAYLLGQFLMGLKKPVGGYNGGMTISKWDLFLKKIKAFFSGKWSWHIKWEIDEESGIK